ncbi:MAG: transketolase C-terminal domain-containing protein, partial [Proteiniphilum sp.]
MILTDGVIGQMMEKVKLPAWQQRRSEQEIREQCPWATLGKTADRKPNIITSLELDSAAMEKNNERFQAKYRVVEATEVRYEEIKCDDADYLLVAFGSAARICQKTIDLARKEGIKVGLVRPITLWPFPTEVLHAYGGRVKGMLTVELNAGQMVEDVRLAVNGQIPVAHYGRLGGIVPTPEGVLAALKEKVVH